METQSASGLKKLMAGRISHAYQKVYITFIVILLSTYFCGAFIIKVLSFVWWALKSGVINGFRLSRKVYRKMKDGHRFLEAVKSLFEKKKEKPVVKVSKDET